MNEVPNWAKALPEKVRDSALSRGLFTVQAAAAYLGSSEAWVRARKHEGQLPHRRIGRRDLFLKADLDRLLGLS